MKNQIQWFKDAKYGLFIHWGIYAQLGGTFEGEIIPYGTEWIMKNARIPVSAYSALAETFNPGEFDAEYIVKKAKQWGMKYIVFTAKHHDGFAMYDSKISDYKITNTPFGRDPLKELAEECKKQDMILGIYYSQMQDWKEENGWGNDWDFKPDQEKDFDKYFYGKVIPQVKELLTDYGNVGIMWFDTPYVMPVNLCRELRDCVKEIQPRCLVSGRIGYKLGDYREMSDNEIPVLSFERAWETPMTLNDTWGYSKTDHNWKTTKDVLHKLVDIVGKGGNLLLNIGPDESGRIPKDSVRVLDKAGVWLEKNGESIYGCSLKFDLPYENRWGKVTAKPGKLYLHVFDYPEFPYEILITGLRTKIKKVYLIEEGKELVYFQSYEPARDEYRFRVILPEKTKDKTDLVVCAEYDGEIDIQELE